MKSTKYTVVVEPFAERHFIKTFLKKHKSAWELTLDSLKMEFEQIDFLFEKTIAEIIIFSEKINICKTEFKIAGTQESRKGSGNRCIVAVHKNTNKVCVLLVYSKTDLKDGNETAKWKQIIKENYPEYAGLF
jgi:hypothetical protein